jgi:hypothetical protein
VVAPTRHRVIDGPSGVNSLRLPLICRFAIDPVLAFLALCLLVALLTLVATVAHNLLSF